MTIQFDPHDEVTRRFLSAIAPRKEAPDRCVPENGVIDGYVESQCGWKFSSLYALSSLVPSAKNDLPSQDSYFISPQEARIAWQLIDTRGIAIAHLFQNEACPGKGSSAHTIFSRMARPIAGQPPVFANTIAGPVYIEDICGYDARYGIAEQVGIHFGDYQVPLPIRKAGFAVVQIARAGKGGMLTPHASGAILSKRGEMVTARHILFDRDGRFFPDLVVVRDGSHRPIRESDVIREFPGTDLVVMAGDPAPREACVSMGNTPPYHDEMVWAIGFPNALPLQRTYTVGTIEKRSFMDDRGVIHASNQTIAGNSGGILVRENGQFVGIITKTTLDASLRSIGCMAEFASALAFFGCREE